MVVKQSYTVRFTTPAFLGDAEQNGAWRTPPFKALLRQWWRVSGRSMRFPADGVTGATRAPGVQKLSFVAGRGPLGGLTPGNYTLLVEAA